MGGKNAIIQGFDALFHMVLKKYMNLEDRITDVAIVMDRDEQEIEETLWELEQSCKKICSDCASLTNNSITDLHFKDESGENQSIKLLPIIIPFDDYGCIESLLMHAQATRGMDEKEIVHRAIEYVDNIIEDGIANRYITHRRFITKAKFSSMVAIMNPDHSTRKMNQLLIDCPWEQNPVIDQHFSLLYDMIRCEKEQIVV